MCSRCFLFYSRPARGGFSFLAGLLEVVFRTEVFKLKFPSHCFKAQFAKLKLFDHNYQTKVRKPNLLN
jgi:hypothetical protein